MTSMMNCVEPGPPASTVAEAVVSTAVTVVTATIWPLVYQLVLELPGHGMPLAKRARKPDDTVLSSVRLTSAPVAPAGTAGLVTVPARETLRLAPPASGPSLVPPGRES